MTTQNKWLCVSGILLVSAAIALWEGWVTPADFFRGKQYAELIRPDRHYHRGIFFAPDATQVVGFGTHVTNKQGVIDFWDVTSQKLVHTITQNGDVRVAVFTPNGKKLITGAGDGKMRIYASPNWLLEHELDSKPGQVQDSLAVFPDGNRFLSASVHDVKVWDIQTRKSNSLPGKIWLPENLVVSKDGEQFAVRRYDATEGSVVDVWNAAKLEVIGRLRHDGGFISVAFSPDGRWIATGQLRMRVILWDAMTFMQQRELTATFDPKEIAFPPDPHEIAFTSDSKLLVCCTGSHSGTDNVFFPGMLCIWNVKSGELVHTFSPHKTGRGIFALSSDNHWLVTEGDSDAENGYRLWDFDNIRRRIGE